MSTCAAASFVRAAGPAAVPFRACCTAALINAGAPGIQCTDGGGLTELEPVMPRLAVSVSAGDPVGAQGTAAAGSDLVAAPVGGVPVAAEVGPDLVAAVARPGDHCAGWPSP